MENSLTLIDQLRRAHAHAQTNDLDSFQGLTDPLAKLTDSLREAFQASVAIPARAVIQKLKTGGALTPADRDLVESLVVGDAEAYMELEQDFQVWVATLAAAVKAVGDLGGNLRGKALLQALAKVEEAKRMLANVRNFLEERARIAKFRATTSKPLDETQAAILAQILEEKLESPLD
jgi:hypothetical protein